MWIYFYYVFCVKYKSKDNYTIIIGVEIPEINSLSEYSIFELP